MLKSIFISHHFDEEGRKMAEFVMRLVASHNINPITGRRLEGKPLEQGVKAKIDACQASIIILTNREEGKSNQWVKDERAYADGKGHDIITLLEEKLYDEGMFSNNERIRIKKDNFHLCLLDLSETVRIWKYNKGKDIKLLIQPELVSEKISNEYDDIVIKYKIRNVDNYEPMLWSQVFARPEQGGATINISGVKDNDLIEIQTNINGEKWACPAINPNVMVKLKKKKL